MVMKKIIGYQDVNFSSAKHWIDGRKERKGMLSSSFFSHWSFLMHLLRALTWVFFLVGMKGCVASLLIMYAHMMQPLISCYMLVT
jgi:hypothetical protein